MSCSDPSVRPTAITVYDIATLKPIEVARSTDMIANARLAPGAITWQRYDGANPPSLFIERRATSLDLDTA